ncbi:hypothetical protein B0T21DRAFT_362206 [Apiosordaria backusii]|uniref:Uncharacterized protein n=1 Tax=Apiosordaria backusii TaxID=314023 RepID=A0AA40BRS8_9PEZI|nr:hypothetical protein B0T21DRAFT_362206 [Apiosordaria backusii]
MGSPFSSQPGGSGHPALAIEFQPIRQAHLVGLHAHARLQRLLQGQAPGSPGAYFTRISRWSFSSSSSESSNASLLSAAPPYNELDPPGPPPEYEPSAPPTLEIPVDQSGFAPGHTIGSSQNRATSELTSSLSGNPPASNPGGVASSSGTAGGGVPPANNSGGDASLVGLGIVSTPAGNAGGAGRSSENTRGAGGSSGNTKGAGGSSENTKGAGDSSENPKGAGCSFGDAFSQRRLCTHRVPLPEGARLLYPHPSRRLYSRRPNNGGGGGQKRKGSSEGGSDSCEREKRS